MNKKIKTILWTTLFLILVIVVVRGMKNNPEWRSFSWHDFLEHLVQVRPGFLLAAVGLTLLVYFLRALRWREFLIPVKPTSLANLWSAVVIGFTAVSLMGRAGEVTRPFVLARKEKLPFTIALTAIIMERIFDFSAILILFLTNLFFFRLSAGVTSSSALIFHLFSRAAAVMLVVMLGVTGTLFLFQMNALRWIDLLINRLRFVPHGTKIKIEKSLKSFVEGLAFVAHPRPLTLSVAYSLAVWLTIVLANFCIIRGFEVPFTFSMTVVLMAFSAMGAVVQLPGVGGGYQALTFYALVSFLGVTPTIASGITLIAWVVAFFPVVGIGLIDLLRGGMSLRSLSTAAEQEEAAAMENFRDLGSQDAVKRTPSSAANLD